MVLLLLLLLLLPAVSVPCFLSAACNVSQNVLVVYRLILFHCRFSLHPPDGSAKPDLLRTAARGPIRFKGTVASATPNRLPLDVTSSKDTRLIYVVRVRLSTAEKEAYQMHLTLSTCRPKTNR